MRQLEVSLSKLQSAHDDLLNQLGEKDTKVVRLGEETQATRTNLHGVTQKWKAAEEREQALAAKMRSTQEECDAMQRELEKLGCVCVTLRVCLRVCVRVRRCSGSWRSWGAFVCVPACVCVPALHLHGAVQKRLTVRRPLFV